MSTIALIVLALISLLSFWVAKGYATWPAAELKRRAREDDPQATALYKVVGQPHSLWSIVLPFQLLVSSALVVALAYHAAWWLTFIVTAALLWLGLVWQSNGRHNRLAVRLAVLVAAPVAWLSSKPHPIADWLYSRVRQVHPADDHTGVYDKSELLNLIQRQKRQADSRLSASELELAAQALTFGDYSVHDILTPRHQTVVVSADEPLGPIVMNELHQSGQEVFLVYEDKKTNLTGLLFLHDAIQAKESGKVRDVMQKQPCYLNENDSLTAALQAVLTTGHQAFMVIDEQADCVGVVTAPAIFDQLVGQALTDNFDQYDDKQAVIEHGQTSEPADTPEDLEPVAEEPAEPAEEPATDDQPDQVDDPEPVEDPMPTAMPDTVTEPAPDSEFDDEIDVPDESPEPETVAEDETEVIE